MTAFWTHHLLSILSFLLTLLFVSSILRTRRAAGSTMAWLLLICVIPYLGIPLYLIFNSRKFKVGSKKAKVYSQPTRKMRPSETTPIQRILRAGGVPDAKFNQKIELFPTGVIAYDRILDLIRKSQKSIHLTTFIFSDDSVGKAVVTELSQKASAGVDVRVLVDSLGAAMTGHPNFAPLTDAGGHVAYFMPIIHLPFQGRTNLRNHRKMMVVDGQVGVLGGMNLAEEYLGPTETAKRWVDLALKIEGNAVTDIHSIFVQDWLFATQQKVEMPEAPASKDPGLLAQVVASGPDVADDSLYDVLLSAINEANVSIRIVTPYFIPDESLAKALELAAKRGVDVSIIIPKRSNHPLADLAGASFVRQLRGNGVNFAFYPTMIHAKALMVDRRLAVLGSANFDMRSLLLNYEIGLVIYSESVLLEVEEWIIKRLNETTPATQKSGFWREMAEGVGRVIGPIL